MAVLGFSSLFMTAAAGKVHAQSPNRRPLTIEDCVRTRRIVEGEVKISPDGKKVAYVVKSPDVEANRNNYLLYVRSLGNVERRDNGRMLFAADRISGIRWLERGRLAARVVVKKDQNVLDQIIITNVGAGSRETIHCPKSTKNYSIALDGQTVVFSTEASNPSEERSGGATNRERELRGYRVLFEKDPVVEYPPKNYGLEVYRRTAAGRFKMTRLSFTGPGDLPRRTYLKNVGRLNLSPDGKSLLIEYRIDELPAGWEEQPMIKALRSIHSPGANYLIALCDTTTGRMRPAFNFPGDFVLQTEWAMDSHSYAVVSPSAFGSAEGDDEESAAVASGNVISHLYRLAHVFTVDVTTGQVTNVVRRDSGKPNDPEFRFDGPLGWTGSRKEMIVRTADHEFARMDFECGKWKENQRFNFDAGETQEPSFASDGRTLVWISQSTAVPADLVSLNIQSMKTIMLTDLNPEYRHISLGTIEHIQWVNRFGSRSEGDLIKPAGYEEGKRYPFVLMATSSGGEFISDAPYTTAFAPQSLANAGFVVLLAKYPIDNKIPKGEYPGGMDEAYNWMATVESAIDSLAERGLIDRDRVGIVGFSRTSWLEDFMLTHSTYRFRAASSADGQDYTFTGYARFLVMGALLAYDAQLGGPPYGASLRNWLDYSVSFTSDRLTAPLLMETTELDSDLELFTLLNRQGKAVELYNYPKGSHPLDTPWERVSSLQRNVDWFRFWMQGFQRTNPADREQYERWRNLRNGQHALE